MRDIRTPLRLGDTGYVLWTHPEAGMLRFLLWAHQEGYLTDTDLEEIVDDEFKGHVQVVRTGRGQATVLYPSSMMERTFTNPNRPEILLTNGTRGSGKSVGNFYLSWQWFLMMLELGESPRVLVVGDTEGMATTNEVLLPWVRQRLGESFQMPEGAGYYNVPEGYIPRELLDGTRTYPICVVFDELTQGVMHGADLTTGAKTFLQAMFRSRHIGRGTWIIVAAILHGAFFKKGRQASDLMLDFNTQGDAMEARLDGLPNTLVTIYESVLENLPVGVAIAYVKTVGRQGSGSFLTFFKPDLDLMGWYKERDDPQKKALRQSTKAPWIEDEKLARGAMTLRDWVDWLVDVTDIQWWMSILHSEGMASFAINRFAYEYNWAERTVGVQKKILERALEYCWQNRKFPTAAQANPPILSPRDYAEKVATVQAEQIVWYLKSIPARKRKAFLEEMMSQGHTRTWDEEEARWFIEQDLPKVHIALIYGWKNGYLPGITH